MKISKRFVTIALVGALITSGAGVYAATALDFSGKAGAWTQKNCTDKQLSRKNPDIKDAVCYNSQTVANNAAALTQQQDKIQTLTTQVADYQKRRRQISHSLPTMVSDTEAIPLHRYMTQAYTPSIQ